MNFKWFFPTEIHCPAPHAVGHGSYHCTSTVHKVGSTCQLTCATGYKPSNSHTTITCQSSSKWSSSASCVGKYVIRLNMILSIHILIWYFILIYIENTDIFSLTYLLTRGIPTLQVLKQFCQSVAWYEDKNVNNFLELY